MPHGRISPNYSPQENAVIDRYVQALRQGKYDTAAEAARDCCRDLARLRREHAGASWAAVPRKPSAVAHQLGIRAQATGRRGFGAAWAPQEQEVVDRYARALTRNRYRIARQAAAACLEELLVPGTQSLCEYSTRGVVSGRPGQQSRLGLVFG